jgi:hypothetical protein
MKTAIVSSGILKRAPRSIALACAMTICTPALATVVADYGPDFETDGSPKTGWSYLWNSGGALFQVLPGPVIQGLPGNYTALSYDATGGGGYQAFNNGIYPESGSPGYVRAQQTTVNAGQTATQDANGIQRYVILAYTFTSAQIATYGNELKFHTYHFTIPENVPGNVDVWAFKDSVPVFNYPGGFPASTDFDEGDFMPDYDFGTVTANQTLYIAIGAQGSYAGEPLGVSFSLALVPEPSILGIVAAAPLMFGMRRRRR